VSASIEWRPVVGFEGLYDVSSAGRVRRVAAGQGARTGYTLHQQLGVYGALTVGVYRCGRRHGLHVRRVVLEAFVGPCPQGHEAMYRGDAADASLHNLYWGSCTANGRRCVLSPGDAEAIRALCANGELQRVVATRYGVTQQSVSLIVAGKQWRRAA
jgi:hypothetical protein